MPWWGVRLAGHRSKVVVSTFRAVAVNRVFRARFICLLSLLSFSHANPQYVISGNAANPAVGVPVRVPVQQQQPVPAMVVEQPHPSLADLSEKDRKQVLGEFLYPKIELLLKSEVRACVRVVCCSFR
jgi:hypothetical protein